MKSKDYRFSKLKKDLAIRQSKGEKYLIWSLKADQLEYIIELGYDVYPYIYTIKTRKFSREIRDQYPLLKDLHYAEKHSPFINKKLQFKDIKILDEFTVPYKPLKYRINLC